MFECTEHAADFTAMFRRISLVSKWDHRESHLLKPKANLLNEAFSKPVYNSL